MPRAFIPVSLGRCRTGGVNDFAGCPPVAKVHIAADLHWVASEGDLPEHNAKIYLALIDTGAEGVAIDAAVAAEIGAKATYGARVHAMNTASDAEGTDIQIIFPSCNLVFRTRAVMLDFHGSGNSWDLILGRSFLHSCRLMMDGPKGLYQLEWIGLPSGVHRAKQ